MEELGYLSSEMPQAGAYTQEEEQQVTDRLRALGYI
jgi:hypothetical protein